LGLLGIDSPAAAVDPGTEPFHILGSADDAEADALRSGREPAVKRPVLSEAVPDVNVSAGTAELDLRFVDKMQLHSSVSVSSESSKRVGNCEVTSESANSIASSTGFSARFSLSSFDQNASSMPTSNSPSRRLPNPRCG